MNKMFEKEIKKLENYLHQVNKMFPSYKDWKIKEEISTTISSLNVITPSNMLKYCDSVEDSDEFYDMVWHDFDKLERKIIRKIKRYENNKNL